LAFATDPRVTDPVREAVDSIEGVLQEMLSEIPHSVPAQIEAFQGPVSAKPMA
jgi:hypothetical protein